LSQQLQAQAPDTGAPSKAFWRTASNKPTSPTLRVRSHTQLSPYLELCCLRVSANVSYQHAEGRLFTGIQVAAKTQQRLVHRQTFEMPEVKQFVEELSVDGVRFASHSPGNPALARIQGGACTRLSGHISRDALIEWVNHQPLASPITCLGWA